MSMTSIQKILSIIIATSLVQGCAAVVVGGAATATSALVAAQDRRTAGTMVEDKTIQIKAHNVIANLVERNPRVHVTPVSYNNRILLVGQVPSPALRDDIEDAVRSIHKVNHIHNEITIEKATSLKRRSLDSWITAKIKSEMALTKEIQAGHIKVVTENGIVYLLGIIKSNEDEIAFDIARHTSGVEKVVKIFEYEA